MTEGNLQNGIRLALAKVSGLILFRNNVGLGWTGQTVKKTADAIVLKDPRPLHAGLCNGSSDLIGWRSVTITPDMVGKRFAMFTAVEVKKPNGRVSEDQINFLNNLNAAGGFGVIARSDEEARNLFLK